MLDEPTTTGLHPFDVDKLMAQLRGLVEAGNTVVVVEHEMRVVAASDWVIDVGPGAGFEGGRRGEGREQPHRAVPSRQGVERSLSPFGGALGSRALTLRFAIAHKPARVGQGACAVRRARVTHAATSGGKGAKPFCSTTFVGRPTPSNHTAHLELMVPGAVNELPKQSVASR